VTGVTAAAASLADPALANELLTAAGDAFSAGLTIASVSAGVLLAGVTWWVLRNTRDARPARRGPTA
jgi:hypothetical protein